MVDLLYMLIGISLKTHNSRYLLRSSIAKEGLPSALDIATLRLCIACVRHFSVPYKTIHLYK